MNGAPFSLLIAADEQFPLELYKNGKTVDEGAVYAIGKLALLTKTSSGIQLRESREEIAKAISKANKIAIAKPELAPYGRAAVQYLKAEGLWDLAKNKLVYADNIGLATTYVVSGAADIGFTAVSLAKSPEVVKETSFLLINPGPYEPIKQRMVLIKGAPQEAQMVAIAIGGGFRLVTCATKDVRTPCGPVMETLVLELPRNRRETVGSAGQRPTSGL
jgi:molybdate transport system substrate-binding protein